MTKNWNKPTVEALDVRMTFNGAGGTSESSLIADFNAALPGGQLHGWAKGYVTPEVGKPWPEQNTHSNLATIQNTWSTASSSS